jgi:transposase
VNGIMYVLSTGCQWRYVPKDLPPKSTLYDYFDLWTYDGTLEAIHHALYVRCREQIGREASPTAAIIDSQSAKSAEKGACIDPHGYDACKKINGKKRHILADTLGLLLHALVHPADIQDRDGGVLVLSTLFGMCPFLEKLFADGGYQGQALRKAAARVLPHLKIEIVKRSDHAKGFEVLPRRWVVERTPSGAKREDATAPGPCRRAKPREPQWQASTTTWATRRLPMKLAASMRSQRPPMPS